jgi:chromosome segregation ATPase
MTAEVPLMIRPRAKSLTKLLQELHACAEQQEREVASMRATIDQLRGERDELVAQLRFATEHANRETRAANSMRIELLARTSPPKARLDFCSDDEHGETTAVLPRPRFVPRRRVREDETERTVPLV